MTIDLTTEQEAIVQQLAREAGKTPAQLLVETMAHLEWKDDGDERRLIEARAEQADRGEFVPAAEMEARFQQMLRPR